jgi:alpha-galactosidase
LLNLGNPRAWQWTVQHFDRLIRTSGVDVYRQDFNIDPLAYWNQGDTPDRRGMTQIRHVTGFLAFWDELLRRHPRLLIDACASGGRRLDVETVRRAVTLWRSDQQGEAVIEQCHTYGLSLWLPYHGTGVSPDDAYLARSAMLPSYLLFLRPDTATSSTLDLARRMTREWRTFAGDLLGDYYPLTPYTTATDVWFAWQFHRPEKGTGVVQAFRRDDNTSQSMRLALRGLIPGATYEIRNADEAGVSHATGHALMTAGLTVRLKAPHSAATITYRRT